MSNEPVWSPDSASLVFTSARDGPPSIFQKPVAGSGQEVLLLKSNRANFPSDWCAAPSPPRTGPGFGGQAAPSPARTAPGFGGQAGGGMIVFGTTDAQTQSDIWMLPLTGDRKPIALLRTPANEVEARCSPDGRWLAYSSDESGRQEIYVTSFPTPAGKWPVSTSGGAQPRWRGDGTELFYVAPDRTVTAVRVSSAPTFEVGAATPLFQLRGTSYAPTANGRRFVTDEPVGQASSRPITVVLNWPAGLKK